LQGGGTGHPKKGVVLLAETDALALEFGGDERMTGHTTDVAREWVSKFQISLAIIRESPTFREP
jgi:hypothetical protein